MARLAFGSGGFGLSMKAKDFFFDRALVASLIAKANKGPLSRAGAMVRQSARQSMKYRPYRTKKRRNKTKPSRPGQPPFHHIRDKQGFNLRKIFFAYDPAHASTVVGPVRSNRTVGSITGAAAHEYGKTKVIRQPTKRRYYKHSRSQVVTMRRVTAKYPARPYMRPALAKNAPKFPALWRDSVR